MTKKKDEHDNFTPVFTEDTTEDGVTDDKEEPPAVDSHQNKSAH